MSDNGYDNLNIKKSSKFLKLEAGDIAKVHFITKEPVEILIHWVDSKKNVCNGDACALCQEGVALSQKWKVEVIDRSDGKIKEFEFGPGISKEIKPIAKMLRTIDKTIHDYDFMINVTQDGKYLSYKVMQCDMPKEITDDEAGIGHE